MAPIDVAGYLAEQRRKATGDAAQEWAKLEELYNKRLWHQLTLELGSFVKDPSLQQGDNLIKLYHNFIADFEHRINFLALAEIVIIISRQYKDAQEAIEFLEKVRGKVKTNDEAVVLLSTAIGNLLLAKGDMDAVKVLLRQTQTTVDGLDSVTSVHGRFYELSSNYHKLIGNHAEYYRDALRFLGCIELDVLTRVEQAERAFNIGLAAILGTDLYNFGELLAHPILNSLKDTDRKWLVDLLFAFNSGNIPQFESLKPFWQMQPDLASNEIAIRQKMALLCLMEMTFRRPATDRRLSFNDIAAATGLPLSNVEHLVMRALSLGLIRGNIDEVDNFVHVTWVQPRVLDLDQIAVMKQKIEVWAGNVAELEKLVEQKGAEIFT